MRLRLLAALAAPALVLAGCATSVAGSASPVRPTQTGSELADSAADALEQAGAVHVSGTFTSDDGGVTGDLQLQGSDVDGTLTVGDYQAQVQIIISGGTVYLNGPADFWTETGAPEDFAGQIADIWIKVPADAGADLDLGDLSLSGLADSLRKPDKGKIEDRVTEDELDGQPVYVVTTTRGDRLLIAAKGTPYPLQLTDGSDEDAVTSYTDFGTQQAIVAPPDAVDVTTLGG